MAVDKEMEAVFKTSREKRDPVSGNEVPTGSLPEEVRDDIPAQLSEGEYVVPADVVRYYGIKFFEDLRADAKQGWATMEANGRVGGDPVSPEGMEMVEPEDDLPFDVSELATMEMDEGGFVPTSDLDTPTITTKRYQDSDGNVMFVTFSGDTPLSYIPSGFKEVSEEEAAGVASQQAASAAATAAASPTEISIAEDDGPALDQDYYDKIMSYGGFNPQTASQEEYQRELQKASGMGSTIAGGLAGVVTGSPIIGYGLTKLMDKAQKDKLKDMEEELVMRVREGEKSLAPSLDEIRNILEGKETEKPFGETILGDLIGWNRMDDAGLGEENKGRVSNFIESLKEGLTVNKYDAMYRDDKGDVNVPSKVAQSDWQKSIGAVKAAEKSGDIVAAHKARLAQSAASKAFTEAKQKETGWTGFFSPPKD